MRENIGKLFKIKPEKVPMDVDATFKILSVEIDEDGDEYCSVEWVQDADNEHRIRRIYTTDLEYFLSIGDYFWV